MEPIEIDPILDVTERRASITTSQANMQHMHQNMDFLIEIPVREIYVIERYVDYVIKDNLVRNEDDSIHDIARQNLNLSDNNVTQSEAHLNSTVFTSVRPSILSGKRVRLIVGRLTLNSSYAPSTWQFNWTN